MRDARQLRCAYRRGGSVNALFWCVHFKRHFIHSLHTGADRVGDFVNKLLSRAPSGTPNQQTRNAARLLRRLTELWLVVQWIFILFSIHILSRLRSDTLIIERAFVSEECRQLILRRVHCIALM